MGVNLPIKKLSLKLWREFLNRLRLEIEYYMKDMRCKTRDWSLKSLHSYTLLILSSSDWGFLLSSLVQEMGRWASLGLLLPLGTLSSPGSPGCSRTPVTTWSLVPDLCLLVQFLRNQEGSLHCHQNHPRICLGPDKNSWFFNSWKNVQHQCSTLQSLQDHLESLHLDSLLQTSCTLDAPRHFTDRTYFQVCFGFFFPQKHKE